MYVCFDIYMYDLCAKTMHIYMACFSHSGQNANQHIFVQCEICA